MAHEPSQDEWRELAREASEERDPERLLDLSQQIVEKYEEEKRKDSPKHDWKQLYKLAVLELDPAQVPRRISDARFAILDRIKENSAKLHDCHEHEELSDAIQGLRVLQQEFERRLQQFGAARQRQSAEG